MNLQAMARYEAALERLRADRLRGVCTGCGNYAAMGAVSAVWNSNLAERLTAAFARQPATSAPARHESVAGLVAADIATRGRWRRLIAAPHAGG
jgi:hypothetical protein